MPLNQKLQNLMRNLPRATNSKIPNGSRGNLATLKQMSQMAHKRSAHPKVRRLAESILVSANKTSHHFLDECKILAKFVQSQVRYLRDPVGTELLKDPVLQIENIERGVANGDCDDMSLLLATLLLSIGAKPLWCITKFSSNSKSFNHIYVCCYEKNHYDKPKRLVMDTILKDKPIGHEQRYFYKREIKA